MLTLFLLLFLVPIVPSLWKHPASPYWMACFDALLPGHPRPRRRRLKRSLKTRDRKLAQRLADSLSDIGAGRLTEKQINAAIEGIGDATTRGAFREACSAVHRLTTGRDIGAGSLRIFTNSWLETMRPQLAPQSFLRYGKVARDFLAFLGTDADRDVMSFSVRDRQLIVAYRDALSRRLSRSSVNVMLKVVRQIFKTAELQFAIDNPARLVSGLKVRDHESAQRRAFTLAELGRILRETAGTEWQGIVLAALYTGQRLGDVVLLRWENIDLLRKELAITTRKTNRRIVIPLAEPLVDYLLSASASDDVTAFVFPKAAGFVQGTNADQTMTLSNQFRDVLARAGLVKRKTHEKAKGGEGRSAKRQTSELSFHSFRHTATSLLKNAGVSQSVVMDIIGHESKAVSQVYTHVGDDEKKRAIAALPSVRVLMRAANNKGLPPNANDRRAKGSNRKRKRR